MNHIREKSKKTLGRVATQATHSIGSTGSIVVHTALFLFAFSLYFFGFDFDKILLVVTTIVSLEAIYLAIFIQMSVNKQAQDLDEVAQDVDEIQKDVEEIQEDVEEIQEDVEEIEKDVDEIQEDVEEISEEDTETTGEQSEEITLAHIQTLLSQLAQDVKDLKDKHE